MMSVFRTLAKKAVVGGACDFGPSFGGVCEESLSPIWGWGLALTEIKALPFSTVKYHFKTCCGLLSRSNVLGFKHRDCWLSESHVLKEPPDSGLGSRRLASVGAIRASLKLDLPTNTA